MTNITYPPPKTEQLPFSFPLNNYNVTYTQYGYPTYEEKMESIEDTGWPCIR